MVLKGNWNWKFLSLVKPKLDQTSNHEQKTDGTTLKSNEVACNNETLLLLLSDVAWLWS